MLISGDYSPSIAPSRAGIVCIDKTEAETHQRNESIGDGRWIIVLPLCCPAPIIFSFRDLEEPYLEVVWVFIFWLTSSGQMEVCGHHIHVISPHLVGEPVPKSSGLIRFFRCLGTTEVVPNQLYSKEKNLPSFCQQRNVLQIMERRTAL